MIVHGGRYSPFIPDERDSFQSPRKDTQQMSASDGQFTIGRNQFTSKSFNNSGSFLLCGCPARVLWESQLSWDLGHYTFTRRRLRVLSVNVLLRTSRIKLQLNVNCARSIIKSLAFRFRWNKNPDTAVLFWNWRSLGSSWCWCCTMWLCSIFTWFLHVLNVWRSGTNTIYVYIYRYIKIEILCKECRTVEEVHFKGQQCFEGLYIR